MKYYIADLHFGHENVRVLDGRPFASVEEMDAQMIRRWNEVVRRKDEVYILGDFCLGKAPEAMKYLEALSGKKYLIFGNHDSYFLRDKKMDLSLFEWVKPYAEMRDNGRKVVLSHYPMICYNGQYRGTQTYMLYGHVHDTMDYANICRFAEQTRKTWSESLGSYIPCQMINCFCGFSDFRPWTLDQWIAYPQIREMERRAK